MRFVRVVYAHDFQAQQKSLEPFGDAELLEAARREGLNLSAVMERALAAETARRWLETNRDAIEAYNADVRAKGVWSDEWRRW